MSTRYVWSKSSIGSRIIKTYGMATPFDKIAVLPIESNDIFWSFSRRGGYPYFADGPVYVRHGSGYSVQGGALTLIDSEQTVINNGDRGDSYSAIATFKNTGKINTYLGVTNIDGGNQFEHIYHIDANWVDSSIISTNVFISASGDSGNATEFQGSFPANDMLQDYTGQVYGLGKGTSSLGTISNASSSTYPRHNYTAQITSICAVIPAPLRRCSHVE